MGDVISGGVFAFCIRLCVINSSVLFYIKLCLRLIDLLVFI